MSADEMLRSLTVARAGEVFSDVKAGAGAETASLVCVVEV
jgi:hypothetical protein